MRIMTEADQNKLIAEFMGQKPISINTYIYDSELGRSYWHIDMMQYSKDWQWLLPVVQKIWKILKSLKTSTTIYKKYLHEESFDKTLSDCVMSNNILYTYENVIHFITTYNAEKLENLNQIK